MTTIRTQKHVTITEAHPNHDEGYDENCPLCRAEELPELQQRLLNAGLGLSRTDFHYHASDLYVLSKPGVREWLRTNYKFYTNIQSFVGAKGSEWDGKACLDIPFAGKWRKV